VSFATITLCVASERVFVVVVVVVGYFFIDSVRKLLDTPRMVKYLTWSGGGGQTSGFSFQAEVGTFILGAVTVPYLRCTQLHIHVEQEILLPGVKQSERQANHSPIPSKRVKLSLRLTKHRAMNTYWGVEVQLHAFFDLDTR
jgi:hypothetical protein